MKDNHVSIFLWVANTVVFIYAQSSGDPVLKAISYFNLLVALLVLYRLIQTTRS